ncbi:transporter substrate-binding domain-containing protein [Pseudooceanicola nanhaiensis]|uniref:transporter substrate-binding domain-containing protein n=1 Tax=Pseudooceanicola nanhaiensis TaxID=375761 RepID=UPI001CD4531E|nr:transporter substrate-binding domain-containing protein [Pseudooceanicola nanhaiensis]MCA0921556.1 transporter substrate-binding domain-containing protein [Pseudooceanicola nanhaiensis]
MIKHTIAALAATLLLPFGAAQAQDGDLELLEPGVLSAATEGTYPPFSMRAPDGKLDGLEIRVMGEIAKRLGLEYKPVLVKWESVLIGLEADQYDIVSVAMDITEERQQKVMFSDGWLESGGRVVVRKDSDITTPADVKGKKVGGLVASNWTKIAEELGGEVKSYKAESDAMQDLANGQVDAIITDAVAAAYAIQTSNLPLKLVEEPVSSIQKGFAIKMGKPNLAKAVNGALADMIADGTYATLTEELIGVDVAPKDPIRTIFP